MDPDEVEDQFALDFFDEVRILNAPDERLVDAHGAVLGRCRAEIDDTEWYAVAIDGELHTMMLPRDWLAATGVRRAREMYYPT
ncbi:hypothetical protein [Krasilnikovia sp. M28-CT-15]|uniref:hypothetical protein n=1 Tax=Krasilnikovia sp. M28-CT-15 TaxID=3373540 RepID=UPI00399CA2BA